jgi:uncharacterized protein (TIGR00255 family)
MSGKSTNSIRSMTGFGEASREVDGNVYHVEIRTVNNRYFKPSMRLPEDFAFMEQDLERLIRSRISRGTVNLRMWLRTMQENAAHLLNVPALKSYTRQLRDVAGDQPHWGIDLSTLALLPGVCQPPEMSIAERDARWKIAAEITDEALDRLIEMRSIEGEAVQRDLLSHCNAIRSGLEKVRERIPNVVAEYQERLHARIEQLLAKQNIELASEDLIREVAIYADRSDINEEIARLVGHCDQFESAMQQNDAAGRKLEFIAQEMLREANTMGSKSGDAELAKHIIEIKSAVDRIKEQVMNVE